MHKKQAEKSYGRGGTAHDQRPGDVAVQRFRVAVVLVMGQDMQGVVNGHPQQNGPYAQ
ncbi:hypothetical protein FQZ97_1267010 [compost metagenome]